MFNAGGTDDLDFGDMPSTLMGQFMEALNSQTNLDDLALNLESFQGGLDCNVDEVRIRKPQHASTRVTFTRF